MNICVLGLGKLGLSTAAAISSRGHKVFGVDINEKIVDAVNQGQCPIQEPDVSLLLKTAKFHATTNLEYAVQRAEITFVIVPTPYKDGKFSNEHIIDAANSLAGILKSGQGHIVVIVSTVMPGTMHSVVRPIFKDLPNVSLAYCPEFIALGSVVENFLNPDWVLIGEDLACAGDTLENFYRQICLNAPKISRMTFMEAEIAKLAQNCFVTMKISFANQLANICGNLKGVDAKAILKAIGQDKRIGQKCLRPGLGFGGPCFPRDNLAFLNFAIDSGAGASLSLAAHQINDVIPIKVADQIHSSIPAHSVVAILGGAYKSNTDVIENSQSVRIGELLKDWGHEVRIFDKLANEKLRATGLTVCDDEFQACCGANACLVALSECEPTGLLGLLEQPKIVIDLSL